MIGDKIKELRIKNNLSQKDLAKILNITTGTIGHYEINDRVPSLDIIKLIADHFSVTLDYLLERPEYMIKIPIFENLALTYDVSKYPFETKDIIGYDYLHVDQLEKTNSEENFYYYLKVNTDSMNLSNIIKGSTILVRYQDTVKDGDTVVFLTDDETPIISRYYEENGTITLIPNSSNHIYRPRILDENSDTITAFIAGKVIKVIIDL